MILSNSFLIIAFLDLFTITNQINRPNKENILIRINSEQMPHFYLDGITSRIEKQTNAFSLDNEFYHFPADSVPNSPCWVTTPQLQFCKNSLSSSCKSPKPKKDLPFPRHHKLSTSSTFNLSHVIYSKILHVRLRVHNTFYIFYLEPDRIILGTHYYQEYLQKRFNIVDYDFTSHNVSYSWLRTPYLDRHGAGFYRGYVLTHENSSRATFSLGFGLFGNFIIGLSSYFIYPAHNISNVTLRTPEELLNQRHFVCKQNIYHASPSSTMWKNSGNITHKNDSNNDFLPNINNHTKSLSSVSSSSHRKRRHIEHFNNENKPNIIEVAVAVDPEVTRRIGMHYIEHYILAMMLMAKGTLEHENFKAFLTLSVVKIKLLNDSEAHKMGIDKDNYTVSNGLLSFCETQLTVFSASRVSWDVSVLITKKQFNHTILGITYVDGMCKVESACMIIQDIGIITGDVIEHELGHLLGAHHDESYDVNCNRLKVSNVSNHSYTGMRIMESVYSGYREGRVWSKCSENSIIKFLNSPRSDCLRRLDYTVALNHMDKTLNSHQLLINTSIAMDKLIDYNVPVFIGQVHSRNTLCGMADGIKSLYCFEDAETKENPCGRLACRKQQEFNQCRHYDHRWIEGSPCGSSMWCVKGKCVKYNDLKPVDGQWLEWSSWSECSFQCGGGVQFATRTCKKPKYGGKYCSGFAKKYRSCNVQLCPSRQRGISRKEQCNALAEKAKKNPADYEAFYPNALEREHGPCKLECENKHYHTQESRLTSSVIDGTPCFAHTISQCPDVTNEHKVPKLFTNEVCVMGKIMSVGCDNVIGSQKQFDVCGVCGGNASACKMYSKRMTYELKGFEKVINLPPGATSIIVRSTKYRNFPRSNLPINIKFFVTNQGIICHENEQLMTDTLTYGDNLVTYTGFNDTNGVRLQIDGPTQTFTDIFVQINRKGLIDLTVIYHLPRDYFWTFYQSEWNACTNECQGTRSRSAKCASVDLEYLQFFDDIKCSESVTPKPIDEIQSCNTDCDYKWLFENVTNCSARCGQGTFSAHLICARFKNKKLESRIETTDCLDIPVGVTKVTKPEVNKSTWDDESTMDWFICEGTCMPVHLEYGSWTPCSSDCGEGIQMRSVMCIDVMGVKWPLQECETDVNSAASAKVLDPMEHRVCNVDCFEWNVAKWTQCSCSGYQERDVECYNVSIDEKVSNEHCKQIKPVDKRNCHPSNCYNWSVTEWSECSSGCGFGLQKRNVFCIDEDHQMLSENHCVGKRPPLVKNCLFVGECYLWKVGKWSECSTNCGKGIQTREIKCYNKSKTVVDDSFCEEYQENKMPIAKQSCSNNKQCYTWFVEPWSECNKSCGVGEMTRKFWCTLDDVNLLQAQKVDDKLCDAQNIPINVTSCKIDDCYFWTYSDWSECSQQSCDSYRFRNAICKIQSEHNMTEVDSSACSKLEKQIIKEPCPSRCKYKWIMSSWSKCSTTCGLGTQSRQVACHWMSVASMHYKMDAIVEDEFCSTLSNKPIVTQSCKQPTCLEVSHYSHYRSWVVGHWTECLKCGRSVSTRSVECQMYNGLVISDDLCDTGIRPENVQSCPEQCKPRSCADILFYNNHLSRDLLKNGEYEIYIYNVKVKIYCHEMESKHPSEYITLEQGVNFGHRSSFEYADIQQSCDHFSLLTSVMSLEKLTTYDPKHILYYTEHCEMCKTSKFKGNFTIYPKVRLNLDQLAIMINDHTFAASNFKGEPLEYGSANDCLGIAGCEQGKFSINLEGTSFAISKTAQWVTAGQSVSMSLMFSQNRKQAKAKCGGRCGSCRPKNGMIYLNLST